MLSTAGAPHISVTPCSLDPAQDLGAVDLAQDDVLGAHPGDGVEHAPPVAVELRERVQVHVAVVDAHVPAEHRGVEPDVAVRQLDALGAGRRARRVVDGGGGVLVAFPRLAARCRTSSGRRRSRRRSSTSSRTRRRPSPASSSGSTSSTRAPEWATMYLTSSATSRKLIGTRTRPDPDTPNRAVSSRAELCDTIATRSPCAMPRASRPAAIARARRAISRT